MHLLLPLHANLSLQLHPHSRCKPANQSCCIGVGMYSRASALKSVGLALAGCLLNLLH
jgi:hypothetical protein